MKQLLQNFTLVFACSFITVFAFGQIDETKDIDISITINEDGKITEQHIQLDNLDDLNLDINSLLQKLEVLKDLDIDIDLGNAKMLLESEEDEISGDNQHRFMYHQNLDGDSERPLLGVQLERIVDTDGNSEDAKGVLVGGVTEGSGAQKAGLAKGDRIISIDGKATNTIDEVISTIAEKKIDDEVSIVYSRDGKEENATAILGKGHHPKMMMKYPCKPGEETEEMKECMERLKEHKGQGPHRMMHMKGDPNKAFLGVTPDAEDDLKDGFIVGSVIDGSTAEDIGLIDGDIIRSINGQRVNDIYDIKGILNDLEGGDNIKIEYSREGKDKKKSGTLKSMQESRDERIEKRIVIKLNIDDLSKNDLEGFENEQVINLENDLEVEDLSIAPNPGPGNFNISAKISGDGNIMLKLYSLSGALLFEQNFDEEVIRTKINITDEPGGTYLLQFTKNGKQFNKKLLKQ